MVRVREVLQRLGWPVESLSDEEIVDELTCRWFARRGDRPQLDHPTSLATANGILLSMANEGNLDALCWAAEDDPPFPVDPAADELDALVNKAGRERPPAERRGPERRRSHRRRASDVINFADPLSAEPSSGFLVDVCPEGIAFIAETKDVPALETRIRFTIHKRDGGVTELGLATVVRTEPVTGFLSLVCAQLEEPWDPDERHQAIV